MRIGVSACQSSHCLKSSILQTPDLQLLAVSSEKQTVSQEQPEADRWLRLGPACAGCEVVFHCATAAPAAANTANKKLMHDVNVKGTQNIIDACISQGVARLVYTSSASVVFDGRDLVNVNEDAPYAAKPIDYYTETKVMCCPVIGTYYGTFWNLDRLSRKVLQAIACCRVWHEAHLPFQRKIWLAADLAL